MIFFIVIYTLACSDPFWMILLKIKMEVNNMKKLKYIKKNENDKNQMKSLHAYELISTVAMRGFPVHIRTD